MIHAGPWIDAQALAKKDMIFEAPNLTELAAVARNCFVKICDGKERFWVLVEFCNDDTLVGTVDNELLGNQSYATRGSYVSFERRHIYEVYAHDKLYWS